MSKMKVLLVDDEEEFVNTLAERLQLRGFQVLTSTDGEAALQVVEDNGPQVVLLDVMMPGLGGLEVLQQIKSKHPSIQVILLTGRGSTKEGIEGMRQGAFDFLMKPIKIEELMEKMKAAFKVFQEGSAETGG